MKKLVSMVIISLTLLMSSAFAFEGQYRYRDRYDRQDRYRYSDRYDHRRHARVIRTPSGRVIIVRDRRYHRWPYRDRNRHWRYHRIP